MAEVTTIINKHHKIILEEFQNAIDHTLTAYSESLVQRMTPKSKQILRLLEELVFKFDSIVELPKKGRKRRTFKMLKPVDLFLETFEQTDNIDWFLHLAHDADPEIFKSLTEYTNTNKNVYKFINTPYEEIKDAETSKVFNKLKSAVKLREYRKLKFHGMDYAFDNLKCLKLLLIDNNWYVATVGEDNILRFNRISFIETVDYATKEEKFQKALVKKQMDFLENNVQNSLTLYNTLVKTVTIKAVPEKAKYFDKGMKKFLSSQTFKEKLADGSVLFTLEYTQPLEILPFIQKWMPYLIIMDQPELKQEYIKNLKIALSQ